MSPDDDDADADTEDTSDRGDLDATADAFDGLLGRN
jgi:hypothetical protein